MRLAYNNSGKGSQQYRNRVLCVTSNFPRWDGDSTTPFVLHLAQDLQELGWRVDVLAPHAMGGALSEELGGVNVQRFKYQWPVSFETVCYQGGALVNLRKNRLNYLKLPALVLCEWFALFRKLASGKYDLLHSHWLLPQGFLGTVTAGIFTIPHVVTVHGSDVFSLGGALLSKFKSYTLQHADAVTVNSSATLKAVTRITPKLNALHLIPMGVSVHALRASPSVVQLQKKYRHGKGPLLLFVGRVVKEKGIEDLLRAVALLVPRLRDVSLLIVGEGQDRVELQEMTESLGLSERVRFCGWVSPDLVPNYLSAGDIFVGPSWTEAQGITFIEAMLMRMPVIATRVGGIVDAVKQEDTGLLVNAHVPDEIALAIERCVKEPILVNHLCTRAHHVARTKYSRRASAIAFSNLFEKLIQKKSRP